MKQHSTNCFDTFIEVAEDCPVTAGEAPPETDSKTAARIEYEMLIDDPYRHTSDDVLYASNGARRDSPASRSSALTKRYGWGVHSDAEGRIAIYPVNSDAYRRLAADSATKHLKAMRSSKKRSGV